MDTLETYRFEIPASQFDVPADELHAEISRVNGLKDVAEKQDGLQDMFVKLALKDGTPLIDTVYDAIDGLERPNVDQQLADAEAQARGVIEALTKVVVKGKPGLEPTFAKSKPIDGVEVDVHPSGELMGIRYIERLPEDKSATRRNQRMSKRHPSGPTGGVVYISGAVPGRHIH